MTERVADAAFGLRIRLRPHKAARCTICNSNGSIELWFDYQRFEIQTDEPVLFWGMFPHQVLSCSEGAQFVVIHAPMALFLNFPRYSALREALFTGNRIRINKPLAYEQELFMQWREDIFQAKSNFEKILEDKILARIRRVETHGWIIMGQLRRRITIGNCPATKDCEPSKP